MSAGLLTIFSSEKNLEFATSATISFIFYSTKEGNIEIYPRSPSRKCPLEPRSIHLDTKLLTNFMIVGGD